MSDQKMKIYNSAAVCGKFKNEIEKKVFLGSPSISNNIS